jgi:hypothetical protein
MSDSQEGSVKKATITHKLLLSKKQPVDFVLLRECFLRLLPNPAYNKDYPNANKNLSQIYLLQSAYRSQMYRLIAADKQNRLNYTYQLNCRPAGVWANPRTKFCFQNRQCPWCATRQIVSVYRALVATPAEIKQQSKLVGWVRDLPYNASDLPFFSGKYGPHQWCDARVTVQIVVPRLVYTDAVNLVFRHIGLQYVPAGLDYPAALTKRLRRFGCNNVKFLQPNPEDKKSVTLQLLRQAFQFNWLLLFQPEHLPLFQALNMDFKKQRFVRINKYKGD